MAKAPTGRKIAPGNIVRATIIRSNSNSSSTGCSSYRDDSSISIRKQPIHHQTVERLQYLRQEKEQ